MTARYRLVRRLARMLLALFYRDVETVGVERVPPKGPLIVVANHPNALIDPMLLLAEIPRPLVPLAKAPLFRHPLVEPFLRLVGAIPVHRRQDEGSVAAANVPMFERAIEVLRGGGAIMIFPEGVSQPDPILMPLKTGAARIALEAAEALGAPPTIVPVGLVGRDPGTFREGWALVLVGAPVPIDDPEPRVSVERLTERIAESLRCLILEADDRETLRLAAVAESIWRIGEPAGEAAPRHSAAWVRAALDRMRALAVENPAEVARLRADIEGYAATCARLGISGHEIARAYRASIVARYAVKEGGPLLLGLPLALWGLLNHGVPYRINRLVVGLVRPEAGMEATVKLGAALIVFPIVWAVEGWLAWRLAGGWGLGTFVLSLAPTGFFALAWTERLERFRRHARGFVAFLVRRDLHDQLRRRRDSLAARLRELAGRGERPDARPEPL